jgi:transcriptional regulator NrdR family protein
VSKIEYYINSQKRKQEYIEKNKLENKIGELFKKRKVSTEDVVRVIDFCKKYIESTKEEEIRKLQNEIDRLTHLKNTLETN